MKKICRECGQKVKPSVYGLCPNCCGIVDREKYDEAVQSRKERDQCHCVAK